MSRCTGVNLRVYLLLAEVLRVLGFSELLSEFSEDPRVLAVLLLELLDLSAQEKVPLSPAVRVGGVLEPRGAHFSTPTLSALGLPLQLV